jgi:hypothetical protein
LICWSGSRNRFATHAFTGRLRAPDLLASIRLDQLPHQRPIPFTPTSRASSRRLRTANRSTAIPSWVTKLFGHQFLAFVDPLRLASHRDLRNLPACSPLTAGLNTTRVSGTSPHLTHLHNRTQHGTK